MIKKTLAVLEQPCQPCVNRSLRFKFNASPGSYGQDRGALALFLAPLAGTFKVTLGCDEN